MVPPPGNPGAWGAHSQLMRSVGNGCKRPSSGFTTDKSQQGEDAL